MKNYLSFLAIAALFAACQSNPNEELGVFFRAGQEVTLTANMPAGNNSAQQLPGKQRVSGKDSNPTDPTNGTINLTWDAGDVILVKVAEKTAEFTLQDGAGTAQATFKGVMPADGTEYSVQYPVSEPNLTTQTYIQNGFGNGLMKMATGYWIRLSPSLGLRPWRIRSILYWWRWIHHPARPGSTSPAV